MRVDCFVSPATQIAARVPPLSQERAQNEINCDSKSKTEKNILKSHVCDQPIIGPVQ